MKIMQPMQMGLSIGVADKKMRGRQRRGPWDLWLRINRVVRSLTSGSSSGGRSRWRAKFGGRMVQEETQAE